MNTSARPTHIGTINNTGIDGGKTGFAANKFCCSLIKRDILLRESSGFFFLYARKKSLHRVMATAESMVQIGEHRQSVTMHIQWLQCRCGNIIMAGSFWKKITRIKAKVISNTHQASWRLISNSSFTTQTLKGWKGQGKPSTVKKVSSCQSMCGIAHLFSQLDPTEETRHSIKHSMFFCTLTLCTHLVGTPFLGLT